MSSTTNDIINLFDSYIKIDDLVYNFSCNEYVFKKFVPDKLMLKYVNENRDLFDIFYKYSNDDKYPNLSNILKKHSDNLNETINIMLYMIKSCKKYVCKFNIYFYYLYKLFTKNKLFLDKIVLCLNDPDIKDIEKHNEFVLKIKYLLFIMYLSIYIIGSYRDIPKSTMTNIIAIINKLSSLPCNLFLDEKYGNFNILKNINIIVSSHYYYYYLNFNSIVTDNSCSEYNFYDFNDFISVLNLTMHINQFYKNIDTLNNKISLPNYIANPDVTTIVGWLDSLEYENHDEFICNLIYTLLFLEYVSFSALGGTIYKFINTNKRVILFTKIITDFTNRKDVNLEILYGMSIILSKFNIGDNFSSWTDYNEKILCNGKIYCEMAKILSGKININFFMGKNKYKNTSDIVKLYNSILYDKTVNFSNCRSFKDSMFLFCYDLVYNHIFLINNSNIISIIFKSSDTNKYIIDFYNNNNIMNVIEHTDLLNSIILSGKICGNNNGINYYNFVKYLLKKILPDFVNNKINITDVIWYDFIDEPIDGIIDNV